MANPLTGLPPRLLRTQEAARFLGISIRTLEKHRTYGTGPIYRKIGGRVLYAVEDLQAWTAIGARKSTRDETAGRVFPARPLTPDERGEQ
ncbi:helix-turn-helix transcriptional regulator [Amorphus sp. MBR-141]